MRVAIARQCRTERETRAVLDRYLKKPHYADIGLETTPAGWIVKATRPASVRELRNLKP